MLDLILAQVGLMILFFHLFSTIELFLPVGMWNVQEALPLGVILDTLALEKVQRFQILGRIAAFLVS